MSNTSPSTNQDSTISRAHQPHHMSTTSTAPADTAGTGNAYLASSTAGFGLGFVPSTREERGGSGFLLSTTGCMEQVGATTNMMRMTTTSSSSLPCGSGFEVEGSSSSFEEALMSGMMNPKMGGGGGGNDGLTRDFLGLRTFSFPNMAGFDHMNPSPSSSYETHNQTPWQG